MIGNQEHAALALKDFILGFNDYLLTADGTTRMVYLINDVIYKVERNPSDCINEMEFENGEAIRRMVPENVKIPDMSLYVIDGQVILACEYINGIPTGECIDAWLSLPCSHDSGECIDPVLMEELTAIGWGDAAYGNAIIRDGCLYLIDVA